MWANNSNYSVDRGKAVLSLRFTNIAGGSLMMIKTNLSSLSSCLYTRSTPRINTTVVVAQCDPAILQFLPPQRQHRRGGKVHRGGWSKAYQWTVSSTYTTYIQRNRHLRDRHLNIHSVWQTWHVGIFAHGTTSEGGDTLSRQPRLPGVGMSYNSIFTWQKVNNSLTSTGQINICITLWYLQ